MVNMTKIGFDPDKEFDSGTSIDINKQLDNMIMGIENELGIDVSIPYIVSDTIYSEVIKIGAAKILSKKPVIRTLLGDKEVNFDIRDILTDTSDYIRVYGSYDTKYIEEENEGGVHIKPGVLNYLIEKSLKNKMTIIDTLRSIDTGIVICDNMLFVGMDKEVVRLIDKNMSDSFIYNLCCEYSVVEAFENINYYTLVNLVDLMKEFIQGYKGYIAKVKLVNPNVNSREYFEKLKEKHCSIVNDNDLIRSNNRYNISILLNEVFDDISVIKKHIAFKMVMSYGMSKAQVIDCIDNIDIERIRRWRVSKLNGILRKYNKEELDNDLDKETVNGYLQKVTRILNINYTQLVYRLLTIEDITIEKCVEMGINDFNEYGLNAIIKGRPPYRKEKISYEMTIAYFMNTMVKKYLS